MQIDVNHIIKHLTSRLKDKELKRQTISEAKRCISELNLIEGELPEWTKGKKKEILGALQLQVYYINVIGVAKQRLAFMSEKDRQRFGKDDRKALRNFDEYAKKLNIDPRTFDVTSHSSIYERVDKIGHTFIEDELLEKMSRAA